MLQASMKTESNMRTGLAAILITALIAQSAHAKTPSVEKASTASGALMRERSELDGGADAVSHLWQYLVYRATRSWRIPHHRPDG